MPDSRCPNPDCGGSMMAGRVVRTMNQRLEERDIWKCRGCGVELPAPDPAGTWRTVNGWKEAREREGDL